MTDGERSLAVYLLIIIWLGTSVALLTWPSWALRALGATLAMGGLVIAVTERLLPRLRARRGNLPKARIV